jgi:predicted  nucleic acid-binding Zn-ribbon protein
MSLFAKIMVVVNLLFAVVFLSAAGTFLGAAENYKQKFEKAVEKADADLKAANDQLNARDASINTLRGESQALETGKTAAESKLSVLQESNATLNKRIEELNQSLQTLTNAQTDLQAKISEAQNEISRLNGVLGDETAARRAADENAATLQNNLEREKQARADAEAMVAAQQEANQGLMANNDQIQTELELYRKEYGSSPTAVAMGKKLDASVQSADNAYDLYVLSVGKSDGVQKGWEFTVSRGGKFVAMIVIDEVYDNYATARSVSGMKKMDVQAGDAVTNGL